MKIFKTLLLTVMILVLAGCSLAQSTPVATDTYPVQEMPVQSLPTTYPYPAEAQQPVISNDWGYPTPEPGSPQTQPIAAAPYVIPNPTSDSGVVVGKIIDSQGKPFLNLMYLGYSIPADQPGFPPMISYDEETSPKSVQDVDGRFYFANVPAGLYGLIIWNPVNSMVFEDSKTQQFLLIEVKPGETTDLGEIVVP